MRRLAGQVVAVDRVLVGVVVVIRRAALDGVDLQEPAQARHVLARAHLDGADTCFLFDRSLVLAQPAGVEVAGDVVGYANADSENNLDLDGNIVQVVDTRQCLKKGSKLYNDSRCKTYRAHPEWRRRVTDPLLNATGRGVCFAGSVLSFRGAVGKGAFVGSSAGLAYLKKLGGNLPRAGLAAVSKVLLWASVVGTGVDVVCVAARR